MAGAAGFNFEEIQVGDILSGINIGNHGVSSEDLKGILVAMSSADVQAEQQQEQTKLMERERRLILGVSAVVGLSLFIAILILITRVTKLKPTTT